MIRINHIRLRSFSTSRVFGADIPLGAGLNIIQADNTSGKSTCMQAIIYGLGLERSLGPKREVPLPYAMRDRIQIDKGSPYDPVQQSYVMLEIENSEGEVVTTRRDITGGADHRLVQSWSGPLLSVVQGPDAFTKRDFFLLDPGAATRTDGFHNFLAAFCGLALPLVPKFDGAESLLYLETLFPMFFVEQKRGWSSTQGPLPTFLGIQDLARRVMEYILDLDAGKVRRTRAELLKQLANIENNWRNVRKALLVDARGLVRILGLPESPTAEFAHAPNITLNVHYNDEWTSLDSCAADLATRSKQLESGPMVSANDASSALRVQLDISEERHAVVASEIALLRRDFDLLQTEKRALADRLEVLRVDLDRNNDAKKLQALGSVLGSAVTAHTCPTCHQDTSRELLPEATARSMGIDENIAFVKSQLDLYEAMQSSVEAEQEAVRIHYRSLEDEAADLRGQIRTIKDDLVRPGTAPTHSNLQELVRLESRLSFWQSIRSNVDGAVDELRQLALSWSEINGKLKSLGAGNLSPTDKDKLSDMQRIMQQLLRDFGFSSFKPEEITLSEDVFRPQVLTRDDEGEVVEKDIGFEVSASDGIRLKWAYYLSILALSQIKAINHVGLLAFDEPGQQQMKNVDLSTLLKWASVNVAQDRQMIISTSEDLPRVRASVAPGSARIHSYSGYILKPIDGSST